jgi:hypothetical protein
LRAKRTKNLGAFRIRPEPLTGRGGGKLRLSGVWWRVAPAPTRMGEVGASCHHALRGIKPKSNLMTASPRVRIKEY